MRNDRSRDIFEVLNGIQENYDRHRSLAVYFGGFAMALTIPGIILNEEHIAGSGIACGIIGGIVAASAFDDRRQYNYAVKTYIESITEPPNTRN